MSIDPLSAMDTNRVDQGDTTDEDASQVDLDERTELITDEEISQAIRALFGSTPRPDSTVGHTPPGLEDQGISSDEDAFQDLGEGEEMTVGGVARELAVPAGIEAVWWTAIISARVASLTSNLVHADSRMTGSFVACATPTGRVSPKASFEGSFVGAAIAGALFSQTGAAPIAAMGEFSKLEVKALISPRHC